MKRSGFTLMELLLVVAILAIVAAVAAPQFFRASDIAMEDARVAQLKANYTAIKAAINMALWDDANNAANVTANAAGLFSAALTEAARQQCLVDRGYITEAAFQFESKNGKKIFLGIVAGAVAATAANPYTEVASTPIFMEKTNLYQVQVKGTAVAAEQIDVQLAAGKTWVDIWTTLKEL